MQTKNEIAEEVYGMEFADLTPGKKSQVTKLYNEQDDEDFSEPSEDSFVRAEIGRVAHNGTKACILEAGATVQDLLDQSGYTLDDRKEKILSQSDGMSVTLDDDVEDGETYVIAPEIKSA